MQTGEGTPPPQVQPPSIDLSVPGVGSGKKPEMNEVLNRPSAMPPIILAPSDSNRSVRAVDASVSPTVTAPVQSSAPTIPGPDIMPRGTATPGLPNASTAAPPPVPPVPTPPTLHLK